MHNSEKGGINTLIGKKKKYFYTFGLNETKMTLHSGKGDIQILMITFYFFYLLVSKQMHF